MTLFEKIYWTLFALNAILAALAYILGEERIVENETILGWVAIPIVIQVAGTFGYLIVKLFLWIWGVSIDLFPSCYLL